jgi:aspartate carbamoyltransferase catalytic subunit
MTLKGKDIIHARDFTKKEVDRLFELTDEFDLIDNRQKPCRIAEGKVLATLFYDPSTRTQFSFQSAMARLGGSYIGWSGTAGTSHEKGEEYEDGLRMMDKFADVIVIRHPQENAAQTAANVLNVPVINCGDGNNQHPTQCVLELYTIKRLKGEIKGLSVSLMGDPLHMRVIHSLVYGLALYDANIILVSPKELTLPEEMIMELKQKYHAKIQLMDVNEAIATSDVLYLTPIAEYRFKGTEKALYEKFKDTYNINLETLRDAGAKKDLLVLHPLPRFKELSRDIDNTSHQGYFKMYDFAIPSKMAFLATILGLKE